MLRGLLSLSLLVLGSAAASEDRPAISPALQQVLVNSGGRSLWISLLVFPGKDFSIRVIDNAAGDDQPRFTTLAEAMQALGGVAGANGGFFNRHPFSPVGGMISGSRRASAVDPNSWMKGLLVVRAGQPALESVESFQDSADITELLQSGPWLVRAGRAESDSSRTQIAPRTFVCHDGHGTWALGASERCTLLELATLLKSTEITAVMDIQEALNFDGGPSTGLWLMRSSDTFYLPEKWPVRNYIGIFPQPTP